MAERASGRTRESAAGLALLRWCLSLIVAASAKDFDLPLVANDYILTARADQVESAFLYSGTQGLIAAVPEHIRFLATDDAPFVHCTCAKNLIDPRHAIFS
jgi:hypothetical protein